MTFGGTDQLARRPGLDGGRVGQGAWIAPAQCEAAPSILADLRAARRLRRRQRFDGLRSCAVVLGLDRPIVEAERSRTRSQSAASGMLAGSAGALQVSVHGGTPLSLALIGGSGPRSGFASIRRRNGSGQLFSPACGIPRGTKEPALAALRCASTLRVRADRPRPGRSHQGRDGRGLDEPQRRAVMAIIGTFTQNGNGLSGSVKTLTLNAKVRFVALEKDSDKAPDYRVIAGTNVELGRNHRSHAAHGQDRSVCKREAFDGPPLRVGLHGRHQAGRDAEADETAPERQNGHVLPETEDKRAPGRGEQERGFDAPRAVAIQQDAKWDLEGREGHEVDTGEEA